MTNDGLTAAGRLKVGRGALVALTVFAIAEAALIVLALIVV